MGQASVLVLQLQDNRVQGPFSPGSQLYIAVERRQQAPKGFRANKQISQLQMISLLNV